MPIYTYQCNVCGSQIERRQSFHDAPLSICEACGGDLRRTLHPVGIVFKGSGFYNTDYRRSGNGASGSSTSDGATKGTNGDSSSASTSSASSKTEATSSSSSDSGSASSTTTSGDDKKS